MRGLFHGRRRAAPVYCYNNISTPRAMDLQESLTVCQLPRRPRGSHSQQRFQKLEITTNFYHVDVKPIEEIHIFRLRFEPSIPQDDRTTRNKILDECLPQIRLHIPEPVFSGFNIYSKGAPVEKQFEVQAATHVLKVKEVKVLEVQKNNNILIHFLNNGLRNLMTKLKYIEIGRSGKYFNTSKVDKIENLNMYSGFKANFMRLEKGIFLRVDTAKKIVRSQTVLQFIDETYRSSQGLSKDQIRQKLKELLINKIIMTNYGKPRYVLVTDIEFADINTTMIPGREETIKEYYMKKYNITIENNRQPLLVIEQKRRKEEKTYMVPEICLMTGIPDDFDEFRRKKISQATIKSAEERKNDISRLMHEIKSSGELNTLSQIGIDISPNMQKFTAKVIPAPRIRLGGDERIESGKESFFNLFAQPVYTNKHGLRLAIIYFKPCDLGELISVFESTSRKLDIELKVIKFSGGEFDSRKALCIIDELLYKAREKQDCNICLIVIPGQLKSQYKRIKEMALLKNKIVCQITTEPTLRKNGFRSIATKILLQLIAKRGNTLWVPQSTLKLTRTMLCAFDNANNKGRNELAGVATVNSTFSSICSKMDYYTDANSKMQCMMGIMLKLVDAYFKRNKETPQEVVIFTNSCSNDQISLYHEYMLNPLLAKLEQLYSVNKPNITMVLVNTKTDERFFQTQGGVVKNVPAGTIIAQNVVSNNYDFFMVSQFANRGSTVPNHYKVIHNDSKMEEGVLQELIYSQCFNYVNWTGSIKVPGILQYAKKCVKFNTEVLDTVRICEELENKLYFI